MESFSCGTKPLGGIKPLKQLGFYVMNKAQNLLLSGTIAIGSIFAVNAQDAQQGELLAINNSNKTEVNVKNGALYPAVREGGAGEAGRHSAQNALMVLYIMGAKGTADKVEPYSAKEYAEILQKAFKNPKFTNNPTDVVIFHEELDREGPTWAGVFINGEDYKTKSGNKFFPPKLIGKYIDTFADAYAKTKGITSYSPASSKADGIALNNE